MAYQSRLGTKETDSWMGVGCRAWVSLMTGLVQMRSSREVDGRMSHKASIAFVFISWVVCFSWYSYIVTIICVSQDIFISIQCVATRCVLFPCFDDLQNWLLNVTEFHSWLVFCFNLGSQRPVWNLVVQNCIQQYQKLATHIMFPIPLPDLYHIY